MQFTIGVGVISITTILNTGPLIIEATQCLTPVLVKKCNKKIGGGGVLYNVQYLVFITHRPPPPPLPLLMTGPLNDCQWLFYINYECTQLIFLVFPSL